MSCVGFKQIPPEERFSQEVVRTHNLKNNFRGESKISAFQDREWDVYMSGALSDLDGEEYKRITVQIYERVAQVCESMGLKCYCPHQSETTPSKGVPHSKVWRLDYEKVVNSGAVVAYIGVPSLGVGAEVEMARTASAPVILLSEKSRQENLSRLILGNPAVVDIVLFDRPEEIDEPLRKVLFRVFSKRNLEDAATDGQWSLSRFRELERSLEETMAAGKFRNLPAKPIGKEEWEKKAKQSGQQPLFDF